MQRIYFIGLDVHSTFCQGGYIDHSGAERLEWRSATSIPALLEVIEKVPRPRGLVIEEGPLSDWLHRHLSPHVDEMVVCDPRRNALIAKEGEKSDPLDWRKLAGLYRGGYVKAVHHSGSLERSLFKQHVQLYHERVSHRVKEALKIIWRLRGLGIFIYEKHLIDEELREQTLEQLPEDKILRRDIDLLLSGYDLARTQCSEFRRSLIELSRKHAIIRAFRDLPGIDWIRAATFFVYVDTPFRFRSKQKLWKYMGIGLEQRQSGEGFVRLQTPRRFSFPLKNVILGAARSAIASKKNNVFADQYQRWLNEGLSPRMAHRNVARSLATVMWGMWKSGSVFDPGQISKTPALTH
jgi:transposase